MLRIHVGDAYGDIPRGVFVVRGENVVLLGEIEDRPEVKNKLREVSLEEILEKQAVQQAEKEETDRLRFVFLFPFFKFFPPNFLPSSVCNSL